MRLALEAGALVARRSARRRLVGSGRRSTRRNTLQSKVAMLRRALGDPSVIASRDGGYALAVEPSDVDALAALSAAATASGLLEAGDDRGAADLCASTLRLYRGDVLQAAGDGDWVDPHRARLEEARMTAPRDPVRGAVAARRRRRRDRRAGGGGRDVPVPGEPVGAADHRAVPSRAPGGRPGDVPAGQEPAGRRARPRPRTAAAAARATDPHPGRRTRRRPSRPARAGHARPGGNLPSMAAELVGREDGPGGSVRPARRRAARGDRRDRAVSGRPRWRSRSAATLASSAPWRPMASGWPGSRPRRRQTRSSTH